MAPLAYTYNFFLHRNHFLKKSAAPQLLLFHMYHLLQGAMYLFTQTLLHYEHKKHTLANT